MGLRIPIPFTKRAIQINIGDLTESEKFFLFGPRTASGRSVDEQSALQFSAVFACVRILAETVASLPLFVYRRLEGGGKERATDHYLYELLHSQPNPEMTSFEFRETLMAHLALWGNAYAEIVRDGKGRAIALWPLRPDRMLVSRDERGLKYEYTLPSGDRVTLRQNNILHIRGLASDGIIGYSPIRMAREAIGLGLAAEEFGARFFSQGSRPSGVLEHPGRLSDEAVNRLRKMWEDFYTGLSGSHRVAILEEGMKWTQIGIPPEDAQFLETRRFQIEEIARIYRIPPHLLGDLERSTYSNIEHQSIEFVVHTIRPWLVRWEQALRRDLFLPYERNLYFAEFLVEGLLRGDIESRYRAYAIGRQNGWLSADDIRELENMNPLPDGQGKVYLIPLNMVPASSVVSQRQNQSIERQLEEEGEGKEKGPGSMDIEERKSKKRIPDRADRPKQFEPVIQLAVQELVKWEVQEIRKMITKHLQREQRDLTTFLTELTAWYKSEDTRESMKRRVKPVFRSYAKVLKSDIQKELKKTLPDDWEEEHIEAYTDIYVRDHINSSYGQLKNASDAIDPYEEIDGILSSWEESRADKDGKWESVQFANVLAKQAFLALGIKYLRWQVTTSNPCPYCASLDGKIVGIDGSFATGDVSVEGLDSLKLDREVRQPPLHMGCSCVIIPS